MEEADIYRLVRAGRKLNVNLNNLRAYSLNEILYTHF